MRRIVFRSQADLELAAAIEWYLERNARAAAEFAEAVESLLEAIQRNPHQYQAVEGEIRRAAMRDFPYALIYRVKDSELIIVSCFHTARDPNIWRDRL